MLHYIEEDISDGEIVYKKGWYFVNEAEQLEGPFETEESAKVNEREYVKFYLG